MSLSGRAANGSSAAATQRRNWWKETSVYQIYPASFQDSTGSGVGDLKGIISRVDYLQSLGVETVWLCPIFESPQLDMGYDISDYYKVDPQYGTVADVDTLRDELHKRGMKLVLDLVVNHTSHMHEWFKQSRSSKDSPYRDWYVWKKPRYDAQGNRQPPNNWVSHFQGSAWEYDEATDEYYLHLFHKGQPDLNWENPKVRAAVHDIMHFWLRRGCDGFRLDVINFISKNQDFPDSHLSIPARGAEHYVAGPRLHEYLQELGAILRTYDAFSVGEMPGVYNTKEVIKSVGSERGELSMIFHFEFVDIDWGSGGKFTSSPWTPDDLRRGVDKWQRFMIDNHGWNALYLENHDQPRAVSRFADDTPEHRASGARMIAMFQGLQAGTPFVYQGQELGMCNVPREWGMEEYQDVDCLNHWALHRDSPDEELKKTFKAEYQRKSRDNARTPMQWTAGPYAGFTSPGGARPWMSVHPNHKIVNAEAQVADKASVFHTWRQVLQARKRHLDIFVYGDFALVERDHPQVIGYARIAADGSTAVVAANFSAETVEWKGLEGREVAEVLVSGADKTLKDVRKGPVTLGPYEGLVVLLASPNKAASSKI